MKKKHIGSAFDEWLKEEGLKEAVTAAARTRGALRADIRQGMADVEAGRVREFDAERIIQKGRGPQTRRTDT